MEKLKFLLLTILLGFAGASWAQSTITGTVTNTENVPIPGVNILVKGTIKGAVTDFDGNYQISADNGDVLIFSYIGYQSAEIAFTGQLNVNVQLKEDTSQLEEVVVVGYGTQSKRAVTGAVATVSAEELGEVSSDAVTRSLAGKIAGVQIQQTTGAPGGNLSIKVRGAGSLSGGNGPLYVIDGFPVENTNLDGANGGFNPLSSINPDDIASIDILKDASAASIYGFKGRKWRCFDNHKKGTIRKSKLYF